MSPLMPIFASRYAGNFLFSLFSFHHELVIRSVCVCECSFHFWPAKRNIINTIEHQSNTTTWNAKICYTFVSIAFHSISFYSILSFVLFISENASELPRERVKESSAFCIFMSVCVCVCDRDCSSIMKVMHYNYICICSDWTISYSFLCNARTHSLTQIPHMVLVSPK